MATMADEWRLELWLPADGSECVVVTWSRGPLAGDLRLGTILEVTPVLSAESSFNLGLSDTTATFHALLPTPVGQ